MHVAVVALPCVYVLVKSALAFRGRRNCVSCSAQLRTAQHSTFVFFSRILFFVDSRYSRDCAICLSFHMPIRLHAFNNIFFNFGLLFKQKKLRQFLFKVHVIVFILSTAFLIYHDLSYKKRITVHVISKAESLLRNRYNLQSRLVNKMYRFPLCFCSFPV